MSDSASLMIGKYLCRILLNQYEMMIALCKSPKIDDAIRTRLTMPVQETWELLEEGAKMARSEANAGYEGFDA